MDNAVNTGAIRNSCNKIVTRPRTIDAINPAASVNFIWDLSCRYKSLRHVVNHSKNAEVSIVHQRVILTIIKKFGEVLSSTPKCQPLILISIGDIYAAKLIAASGVLR